MATITFQNNQTVTGTSAADSMVGIAPAGNFNDIIYGLEGNDTINSQNGISDSTIFGGQGNDTINPSATGTNRIANDAIYGNFGDDAIVLVNGGGDRLYGGQGNDFVESGTSVGDSLFGNQGNDVLVASNDTAPTLFGQDGDDFLDVVEGTGAVVYGNLGNDGIIGASPNSVLYGGHGNDTVEPLLTDHEVAYGNFENDVIFGANLSNSVEYGGQGDDTLIVTGDFVGQRNTNDSMSGGLGNDLFVASNQTGNGVALNANDIVTVTDFLRSDGDKLSMSREEPGNDLFKINGSGDNAADALKVANNFYAQSSGSTYLFVYGGTGAGYLFYNGDSEGGFHPVTAGMALLGKNGEHDVEATDITTSPFA